ncbi:S8 family serine peptidase [Micromonospora sp. NBC_01796]|uniref:S8 family serine peptidase n=1 Tax=Micromonospora sp. NBC_01796 TaxID=2975987 RepID=UPI002DD87A46|nr:S8 family serine peptidase [Micromonospora sp. NBC_01796]WSA84547.1 S8 family serine peptidase [Micromonospora sp. NBC_01796]
MAAQRRSSVRRRWWSLVLGIAVVLTLPGQALAAPAAPGESYLKYYVVTSAYQGEFETLERISFRFLGTTERADDIFDLNAGRRQADGGVLTEPGPLPPGWLLVLPWDATGEGVRYGLLSAAQLGAGPGAGPGTGAPPNPSAGFPVTAPPVGGTPVGAPVVGDVTGAGQCPVTTAPTGPDRTDRRPDPGPAWARTEGEGVMVAVVDSGVDGGRAGLTGRVAVGVDITAGSARGDVDCLGSGTAMAGIIAGRATDSAGGSGMAPAATVLPVRVVTTTPQARSTDVETGIQVAVSAGAGVIALGGHVALDDPVVAAAVESALSHDVVVVAGAAVGDGSTAESPTRPETALLRVGGLGADGQPATGYRPGAVQVVAPDVDPVTGTSAGSGTPYAVAFVAGTVALVRSAFPNLSAEQVAHRIRTTAEGVGASLPDPGTGWGLVDPGAAVTAVLAEEGRPAAAAPDDRDPGPVRVTVVVVLVLLLAGAAVVLTRRARRTATTTGDPTAGEDVDVPSGAAGSQR